MKNHRDIQTGPAVFFDTYTRRLAAAVIATLTPANENRPRDPVIGTFVEFRDPLGQNHAGYVWDLQHHHPRAGRTTYTISCNDGITRKTTGATPGGIYGPEMQQNW